LIIFDEDLKVDLSISGGKIIYKIEQE